MPIQIVGDTHTHTVACGHAMGTVTENLAQSAALGHRFLAVTEHTGFGAVPWGAHPWFFLNLMGMPRVVNGVVLLRGCEVNAVDSLGTLDLDEHILRRLDLVIASAHVESYRDSRDRDDYTELYLALAANPLVDVIGHSGDPRFTHDMDRAVRAYRDHGKIVEFNAHSPTSRCGSEPRCLELARLCARYGVPVLLSSDAHCPQQVGDTAASAALLTQAGFPSELVLNADYPRFRQAMEKRRGLQLPE